MRAIAAWNCPRRFAVSVAASAIPRTHARAKRPTHRTYLAVAFLSNAIEATALRPANRLIPYSSVARAHLSFLVMACFVLVEPPLAARLLRHPTRHVASDGPTSNQTEMRPAARVGHSRIDTDVGIATRRACDGMPHTASTYRRDHGRGCLCRRIPCRHAGRFRTRNRRPLARVGEALGAFPLHRGLRQSDRRPPRFLSAQAVSNRPRLRPSRGSIFLGGESSASGGYRRDGGSPTCVGGHGDPAHLIARHRSTQTSASGLLRSRFAWP